MKKLAITIFFTSFALILVGLVIVMSASSTYSALKFDSSFHLFQSHLIKVAVGILVMGIFCIIPYQTYRSFSKGALIGIILVLIYTLIFAPQVKGAGRWLNIGFISIQPADIAKIILIIHLSNLIATKQDAIKDFKDGFKYFLIWVPLVAGLIFLQPNVSNAVLITVISFTMMYVGGARLKHIFISSLAFITAGGSVAMIFSHSRARILSFINSFGTGGDINLQVKQAVYSLGSGGISGVGLGNGKQSNLFLPEAYGDFIFAILGEETGFGGVLIVIFLYLVLFFCGILIAKKTKDKFGQLLAFGISFSIILYAFVNAAVVTGMFPTTGLPLPFISYGGTSIIFLSASVGILINIAILNHQTEKNKEQNLENNELSKLAHVKL